MGNRPSLRARMRAGARAEVADIAFGVFAERGFEQTTATEVAEAAGISRATFFRYFASKEEAVFVAQEAVGAEIALALAARPSSEEAWTALRHAFVEVTARSTREPAEALARARLTRETPSLRAHQLERQAQWGELIGAALAERLGEDPRSLPIEALVGAALSALDAAVSHWGTSDGTFDMVACVEQAFDTIRGPDGGG
jgi:AcrR family transcriptional regulator